MPAAAGIDNPDCVKWSETLPSQEESAGRDIPMGQLVTKVLMCRESPLLPSSIGLALIAPSRGVKILVPTDVHPSRGLRVGDCCENPPKKNWYRPIPVKLLRH